MGRIEYKMWNRQREEYRKDSEERRERMTWRDSSALRGAALLPTYLPTRLAFDFFDNAFFPIGAVPNLS